MKQRQLKTLVWIIFLGLCSPVPAEDLASLLTRVKALDGTEPIHAIVTMESECPDQNNVPQHETAEFNIAYDANGLSLTMSQEAFHADVLKNLSLHRVHELISYASTLVDELKDLELVKQVPDTYADIACQHWQFEDEKKESKFGVKAAVSRNVDIWTDNDGYPIAASFKSVSDVKILFWKHHQESTRPQRYQRFSNRLILIEDKQTKSIRQGKDTINDTVTTRVKIKER